MKKLQLAFMLALCLVTGAASAQITLVSGSLEVGEEGCFQYLADGEPVDVELDWGIDWWADGEVNNFEDGWDAETLTTCSVIPEGDLEEFCWLLVTGEECIESTDDIEIAVVEEPAEPADPSLTVSSTFPIEGDDYTVSIGNIDSIAGAVWTKDGSSLTKAVSSGGGATDTSLTFSPLELSDAGEYCVVGTGTVNFNEEDVELAVDLCVSLGDIQTSGTTIPATGTLGLTILSALVALVGVAAVRRRQLS